jgi:hypothetical protein
MEFFWSGKLPSRKSALRNKMRQGGNAGTQRKSRKIMEPEVIQGLALAATFFGATSLAGALISGGSVPMIALGLTLMGLSMDLFIHAKPRDEE